MIRGARPSCLAMTRPPARLLSIALAAFFALVAGRVAPAQDPVRFELLSDVASVAPGSAFKIAVKAQIASGYHIYWTNPGETGQPTTVDWTAPAGFAVSETLYPVPHRYVQKFTETFSMVSHTYEGEVYLIAEVTAPDDLPQGGPLAFSASVNWMACDENGCTPPNTTEVAPLSLPVADAVAPSGDAAALEAAFAAGAGGIASAEATIADDEGLLVLQVKVPEDDAGQYNGEVYFLPDLPGLAAAGPEPIAALEDGVLSLILDYHKEASGIPDTVSGFIVGEGVTPLRIDAMSLAAAAGGEIDPPPGAPPGEPLAAVAEGGYRYPAKEGPAADQVREAIAELAGGLEKQRFPLLLLIGAVFLGGLILNLMPCVFPVLGIKILGFVQQAGSDRAKIRRHGWVFAAGVVLSLWLLVAVLLMIRAAGASAGWGFQLQEPWFLIFLIAVMFVFALNLAGVFELGTSLTGAGSGLQAKHGYSGSFFSGVLAVLVATPCTGPFMGPALGFALTGSPVVAFAIFTALGAGLALPYVLLSYFPALIQKLPRPGPWMESFKQFMSFPLFATVVWLLAVLGKVTEAGAIYWVLFGLVVLGFGLWIYGRYATPVKKPATRWVGRLAALGCLGVFVWFGGKVAGGREAAAGVLEPKVVEGLTYEPFDPVKALEYVRNGRDVYIDYTAVW